MPVLNVPAASLKPSAEECFRRAGEMAPDWSTPALELLREYAGKVVEALDEIRPQRQRGAIAADRLFEAAEILQRKVEIVM